jgi:hypothetical protein
MEVHNITVKFPKEIILENGSRVTVEKDKITDESLFSLLYPAQYTDNVAVALIKNGFHDATPSFFKGEVFSLAKEVSFPWELHLRLFNNGKKYSKIFAHVEISRKYFEHLFIIQPVVYEPFNFYSDVYKQFRVLYEPSGKIVKEFKSNYEITLMPPENLIEWMPVVVNLYDNLSRYKEKVREIIDILDYELHSR